MELERRKKERAHVTKKEIKEGLRELCLKRGDAVFVHSSLSKFGYVHGGAEAVVDALLEVVGYGTAHIFGRAHGRWIDATPDLKWVAVCDKDPERLKTAKDEFPRLETYANVTGMLEKADIDMVSIVTPHHTHAPIALECIRAGKHVVVDKAMCLSVAEATSMIDEAKKKEVMLAVFHVRRHDGNFRAIKETVHIGAIGDVFHIELTAGGLVTKIER